MTPWASWVHNSYGFYSSLGKLCLGLVLWRSPLPSFGYKGGERWISSDVVASSASGYYFLHMFVTCDLSYEHNYDLCSELSGAMVDLVLRIYWEFSYSTIGLLCLEYVPALRGSTSCPLLSSSSCASTKLQDFPSFYPETDVRWCWCNWVLQSAAKKMSNKMLRHYFQLKIYNCVQ